MKNLSTKLSQIAQKMAIIRVEKRITLYNSDPTRNPHEICESYRIFLLGITLFRFTCDTRERY